MDGVIVKVDQYPKKDDEPYIFTVRDQDGLEKRFQYSGFLPIKKEDVISIGNLPEQTGKGKKYVLDEKPLVYIPQESENLFKFFREALVESRNEKRDYFKNSIRTNRGKIYPINIGEKIYEEMFQKFGDHNGLIEAVNSCAVEFFVSIDEKERNTIYRWWKKNILRRQLYLLGLYNKEIDDSGLREDILFEKIKENPIRIQTLSIERAVEINNLFQRETTPEDLKCGEIVRKLDYYKKRKGWYYTPEKILKKNFEGIEKYYESLFSEYGVVMEDSNFYTQENHDTENHLSSRICEMIKQNEDLDRLPKRTKNRFNVYGDILLTNEQEEALEGSLKNTISVITGGAGCGKTTLMKQIVRNIEERGRKFILTSFTGKAVMRIKEVVCTKKNKREYEKRCITLSRIIHKKKTFQSVPYFDTLIIDEASMVSTDLFHTFSKLFPDPFSLILVGDCNQLDPVDSGAFFKEVIKSGRVPVYKLTINKRSEEGTVIVKNANGLISEKRDYKKPYRFISGEGFYMIEGDEKKVGKIIKGLSQNGVDDKNITVLTPVNRFIPHLVEYHQKYFLRKKGLEGVSFDGEIYYRGDRMMQKKNFYSEDLEIMNGEEGSITNITEDYLEVTFREEKVVSYRWKKEKKGQKEEIEETSVDDLTTDSITHSFAKTIHKSQGSEYDYVIIYIPPENLSFISVNMLYTSVTRGRKKVWIVSNLSTIDIISTQNISGRKETLSRKISNLDRC